MIPKFCDSQCLDLRGTKKTCWLLSLLNNQRRAFFYKNLQFSNGGQGDTGETGATGGEWGENGSNTADTGDGGTAGKAIDRSSGVSVTGTLNSNTIKGNY